MSQNQWQHVVHERDGRQIVELTTEKIVVRSADDILDVMANLLWNNESDAMILHERHVAPEFFDLSTGVAGEIIQKSSNYKFRLALVGDYQQYESESLHAFIRESNRGRHVYFAQSLDEALSALERD